MVDRVLEVELDHEGRGGVRLIVRRLSTPYQKHDDTIDGEGPFVRPVNCVVEHQGPSPPVWTGGAALDD